MMVVLTNAQRECPVNTALMARVARRAVRTLRIRTPGTLAVTFIGSRKMRALNKRFLRHDRMTDVLSFRYDTAKGYGLGARGNYPQPPALSPQPIVGEILIAPRAARAYAKQHDIPYAEELARYVVHGLLHWLGHEDRTLSEQRAMRSREDRLLSRCGVA